MTTLATRTNAPSAIGAAQRAEGLANDDAALLVDAVSTYRESPRRIELAATCEDAGAALLRAGRDADAAAVLDEAAAVHLECGAVAHLARRRGAPAVARHPPPASPTVRRHPWLGGAQPDGALSRRPRRPGDDQHEDRRSPLHLAAHRRDPCLAHLPQARRHQPGSTRRRRHVARRWRDVIGQRHSARAPRPSQGGPRRRRAGAIRRQAAGRGARGSCPSRAGR